MKVTESPLLMDCLVLNSPSTATFGFAPCSSSHLNRGNWLSGNAHKSGVILSLPWALTSAPAFTSRSISARSLASMARQSAITCGSVK
jgi:hypothetical protein